MLTLIHGDDVVSSRKALEELKMKFPSFERVVFPPEKANLTDIVTAFDSMSLFTNQKLIIIENLITGPANRDKEEILKALINNKLGAEVVLWEGKEVSKTTTNNYFSAAKVIFCRLPAVLFKFLDSIGEKPLPTILSMLEKLSDERGSEFIFTMLIRQWRNLLVARDLGMSGFTGVPAWQALKFINQARYFDAKNLISSYRLLLSLDIKVKRGKTPYSLRELLDIFFVSVYYQI